MPISNPFVPGKAVDLSSSINIIPNQWGLIQQMGLFRNEYKSQKVVMLGRSTEADHLLVDRNWDERNSNIVGRQNEWLPVAIPHFPVDDAITPNDVDGVIDFEALMAGQDNILSIAKVRAEKMERLRKSHSNTLEFARSRLLATGDAYAPNGTIVTNYYNEFGYTRQTIYMNLDSTTVNPLAGVETVISTLQDGIKNGDIIDDFVALCSPEFFAKLTQNQFIYETYLAYTQPQAAGILNQRLPAPAGMDARYRSFRYGGILFIEVRGGVGGQRYVTAGQAYVFPRGIDDAFRTFFAPANRFATINRPAVESYFFEYKNEKDDIIEIMSETNFLNVLARPELVITLDAGVDD
jgi:hypothetical protein